MKKQRILLKISGETLTSSDHVFDIKKLDYLGKEIRAVYEAGHEIAIVLGGGNIWRERDNRHLPIPRVSSDHLGMLATVMNAVVFSQYMQGIGCDARVFSPLILPDLTEFYTIRHAKTTLERHRLVFCAGGTGNPFFTTDSAAALRALELECTLLIKATKVNGIYDSDPVKNPDAKRYDTIEYQEAIEKNLSVMDQSAFSLCREHNIPIIVLNINDSGALLQAVEGKSIGTRVEGI